MVSRIMERTLRVLLVEDAPFLRYAFSRLLRMQGYDNRLSDEEVATLTTFLREGWHNKAPGVSAAEVKAVRDLAAH